MAIELGSAYFTLLPSMAGTAAAVKLGLGSAAVTGSFAQGGAAGGAAMGGGIAAGLRKAVPVIGGVLAGIGIANLFSDAIAAGSDLNESANAIRVSFGEASAEIEKLGETAATRLGLSQVDFNSLAVRFAGFAGKIAGDGGDVTSVIDKLTTRGADFASVYNLEVADALQLFQSGLAGESEPLRQFSVDLSAVTVTQTAYRLGIAEVGTELTEQQKIQARYAAILEQTSKTEGDRANTANEYAGQQRTNAATWEDALARIGTALLPVATTFAEWLGNEDNIERLDKIIDLFIELAPAIGAVAEVLLGYADLVLAPLDAVFAFFDAIDDGVVSLEELRNLTATIPDGMQGVVSAMANFIRDSVNMIIDPINQVSSTAVTLINGIKRAFGATDFVTFPWLDRIGPVFIPGMVRPSGRTHMADGGRVLEGGWSWVGERGPEQLWLPQDAVVEPLPASRDSEGATINVTTSDPLAAAAAVAGRLNSAARLM